jgi:YHS domain-containing protein
MFKRVPRRVVLVIGVLFIAGTVSAGSAYNTDSDGVAVKGYVPVAYFTMEKPVKGMKEHAYEWEGATWWFSSKENMKLFMENPEKYAPQYGGYCAYGVAVGALFDIKPEAWNVVDGKLYLNKNLDVRKTWREDTAGNIKKADENWPGLMKK